jgi:beta-glucanase (GH16 family)
MKMTSKTFLHVLIAGTLTLGIISVVNAKPPGKLKDWKIVWQDEFAGEKLDLKKWDYWHSDTKRRKAINKAHNTYLDGKGNLVIRTQKEGDTFTAGGLWTHKKFRHTFGYWEFRCSFEQIDNIGHWPACWVQTPNMGKFIGDPNRGGIEIDVMELPRRDDTTQHAIHWDGYKKDHKSKSKKFKIKNLMKGFHTFGLLWTENELVFYVDDKETWRAAISSHVPQYIILSEEIDKWGGPIEKEHANLPDYFLVDYVCVYMPKQSN